MTNDYFSYQVTLEEQMICGALQTLNEEAFEDVVCSERPTPSPTGQVSGEMIANNNHNISTSTQLPPHLAPIRESVESGSFGDLVDPYDHFHSSIDLGYGNTANNFSTSTAHPNAQPNNHAYVLLDHLPFHQQQCPLDNVHNNEPFTVDQQQHQRNHVLRGPLPTVILMPSSTVDDTPL